MTPALKAMVEAMISEIRRQDVLFEHEEGETDPKAVMFGTGERLDLEKVARAGFTALRKADTGLILAGADMNDSVGHWWPIFIDEILKETL